MSDIFEQLAQKKKEYDELLSKEGENALKEVFKKLFEANPNISRVSWTQYIPSWNDGDACTFRLGELYFKLDGIDEDEYGESDGFTTYDYSYRSKVRSAKDKVVVDIKELWNKIARHQDILESVFGEGVKVIVTPKGITIDEYDCGY